MCCVSCCGLRCTVTGADLTTAKRNRRAATAHLGTCETVGVGSGTLPVRSHGDSGGPWPVRHLGLAENRDCRISPGAWHSLSSIALCRFALAFSARLYFQYQNMYSLL